MNAKARRKKYKEELRRVILDAARDVFVTHGYEGFSMRKLAERIEYSPGSVYLHFKSKEVLHNPNDYRFVFMLKRPVQKRPYKVHGAFEALRYMVRCCVEERWFREVDVETAAQALWASAHGITSLLIQRPAFPWVPKKELLAQIINTTIDSLVAAPKGMTAVRENHANSTRV